jgi:hypothetical protein
LPAKDALHSPKSADEWVEVADRALSNLRQSYLGKLTNEMKVDLAIKAVEAILKAIFWKHERLTHWPLQTDRNYRFLYKHNIDVLLQKCGLQTRLKAKGGELWASWLTLVNASASIHRYSSAIPSDAEANEVAKAARHPDKGVIEWLKEQYRQIN